jgi:hypothetical protein
MSRLATNAAGAPWSADDRADAALCSALLGSGGVWWALASVGQLGWWLLPLFGALSAPFALPALAGAAALATLLWIAIAVWAMRVRLDAQLFAALARDDGPWDDAASLDQALARGFGRPRLPAPGRDMAARCAGAQRLFRRLVIASLLHLLGLLAAGGGLLVTLVAAKGALG